MALTDILAKITHEPAAILGIDKGHLSIGSEADICLFNPEAFWQVNPSMLFSQGKNTPFLQMEVPGRVHYTLVHGQIVYDHNC